MLRKSPATHSLFSVFGIEIEYALVMRDSLAISPTVDQLLKDWSGSANGHPALGNVEADNELAAHVLEIKCQNPGTDWIQQTEHFQNFIVETNQRLAKMNCQLLPGGMHPFMNPLQESQIWAHDDSSIYESFDRIFGVRGHGWFNIQSVHLNLPFGSDAEFSQLHNAISLLLPLLPALSAASPIFDGKTNGWVDGRLFHYISNQKKLPSIIGGIIPEPVGSEEEYQEKILVPMYAEIAPLDPEGLLAEEWLNSRAAIARFDRNAIEIRCMDTQERPLADMALCYWVTEMLQGMLESGKDFLKIHRAIPAGVLRSLFLATAQYGQAAKWPKELPLGIYGIAEIKSGNPDGLLVRDVLKSLKLKNSGQANYFAPALDLILNQGNLAERILKSLPQILSVNKSSQNVDSTQKIEAEQIKSELIKSLCQKLALCLNTNAGFSSV